MPLLRHLAILFAFLAAFARPTPASAFTPASPGTRVGGFEVAAHLLVGELGPASREQHQGIGAAYDENASGYRFAAGGGARAGARNIDDLVAAAQKQFPGKAGQIEYHHITPKYLGGSPKGPTVPIDAAYHQQITNAFRELHPYGRPPPSPAELQRMMQQVYERFPLPGP